MIIRRDLFWFDMYNLPVGDRIPSRTWWDALGDRGHSGWGRLRILLGVPGWSSRAVVGLGRRVDNLLLVLLGMEGPVGSRYGHTSGTNERMVGRSGENTLTDVGRITQNRTGWHLRGQATNCASVLRQVEGD